MAYEIASIGEDELGDLHRVVSTAFGEPATDEKIEDERLTVEYDRMIGVRDNGQFIAGAGAYSFELTLPGLTHMPVAGVTWVGCLPSHRRQGVLTSMMRHQLDDIASRGESVAILTASEAVIYGRFGYGLATQAAWAKVPTSRSAFAHVPEAGGRMRYVWGDERAKVLPPVYDAWRRARNGAIDRHEGKWKHFLLDREWHREGASSAYTVVHENDAGVADGYVWYRVRSGKAEGANTTVVTELIATDPAVEAALWRFVLDLDLAASLDANEQPLDSVLPWLLADHRAYRIVHVNDFLWARIVDTRGALAARRYASEGSLVLEVVDDFRPDGAAAGRFRLDAAPSGTQCIAVDSTVDADLTMPASSLGSLYLGGVKCSALAAAGRVSGSAEAVARADTLFATTPLPYCNTGF